MSQRQGSVRLYMVADVRGRILAGNLPAWPAAAPAPGAAPADVALPEDGHAVARVVTLAFADGTRLLVGRDLAERHSMRRIIEKSLAAGGVLALALGFAVGLVTSRHALRRLDAVNHTAAVILAGDLSGRVPLSGRGDEFDFVAAKINGMLDRIQRLVGVVRTVTANVAHDLRTPLNRLRSRLEVTLVAPREPEEYRHAISRAIAEADALIATFNAMLRIAKIEGRGKPPAERVDLGELALSAADLYQPLAEDKGVRLQARAEPGTVVPGDAALISQALNNLLDNAVKYTPAGGSVTVSVRPEDGRMLLDVCDNGPGIPAALRDEVLQPFTRLDASRHEPGSGLGLSLVAAVAEHHGARLALADSAPGLTVTLAFPLEA